MLSFRAFREVESPIALDLVAVRAFRGMAGMDESNASLRTMAEQAGTSLGAIYGRISALSVSHDDQFVEMLAPFVNGDAKGTPNPASRRSSAGTGSGTSGTSGAADRVLWTRTRR